MLALRQLPNETEERRPPSSSSARASSPVTQASPPPSETSGVQREARVHKTGDVLDGRYVLIEQLGRGGMGVVWKARSTALEVEVAVKLVRGAAPSAESFKRMAREAHAAARLGHPAMATVLDFGATVEGDPYVVMELLHGESLGEVLGRERRVDPVRAVSTLLPIMDGLKEAHDKGIVHRDLKPENLFISKGARGRLQPKVLDFGIAKLEHHTDSSNTRLTQDGAVLGSPGYFSPEQARGQADIDFRTDIWSISVVLYELITGELPFSGANYNALLMSILKDAPASIMSHGYGDDALWRIVQRGLHRDRNKRWGSMWELGRALASWLYDKGVRADISSRSLKEGWLDPKSQSEQAPALEGPAPEGGRGRVLSTLIKRRVADTLAGETLSAFMGQHRLPTKLMGWGAMAAGIAAISWSVLAQTVSAPRLTAGAQPSSARELASPEGRSAGPAVAAVDFGERRDGAETRLAAQRNDVTAKVATTTVTSARSLAPKATERTLSKSSDVAAKARRVAASAPARPKTAKAAPRKRIDQEFGF